MKKTAIILVLILMASLCFAGCSKNDGKCNEWGETAYEITETDMEYMKKLGIKYKDELCQEHYQEKMIEEISGNLAAFAFLDPDSDPIGSKLTPKNFFE